MGFPDADYDKNAPWNQKDKKLSFDVTATITKTVTVTVPEDYDEQNALLDVYYNTQEDLLKRIEDWNVDDINID